MQDNAKHLQIRFCTKQERLAVPDVPHSVPATVCIKELNELVNQLLQEDKDFSERKDFDFLVKGELLRVTLLEHLQERDISTEITIDVEYIERTPAPEPENSLLHDDWVSSIHTVDKWILSGCYDCSINIWTTHGKLVAKNNEHKAAVKEVSWISTNDPGKSLVSVSHDSTAVIWAWNVGSDTLVPKICLRGHERGIDCVGVSLKSSRLATGGWDTHLKIWTSSLEDDESEEPAQKKNRGRKAVNTRTPLHTLKGHKEAITSIKWIDDTEICSVSMDHTIKLWDAELCGIKNEIIGQKAFLCASWSPISRTLLASSADRHIRLYDARSAEGSICKTTFTSHSQWVPGVEWSKLNEYLFMSGGYDSAVKVWDTRSHKAPLYNLEGHEGQVLCVNWSNQKYLVSGGSDSNVHIFKHKRVS